ncbi:hypothetical protein [Candidatus Enterococcus leclercqii]|uniref:hypothetical protein n=1 Tax=Candidatus Enterococcus leclercqii TaxID=1857218 RepID=UPI00137ABF7B|nr:hypothetical protein [Enterococcus sp. CU9D]KAF1293711.1 hypothetical protein BAU14_13935 [Enterococcus sp. CU9D]
MKTRNKKSFKKLITLVSATTLITLATPTLLDSSGIIAHAMTQDQTSGTIATHGNGFASYTAAAGADGTTVWTVTIAKNATEVPSALRVSAGATITGITQNGGGVAVNGDGTVGSYQSDTSVYTMTLVSQNGVDVPISAEVLTETEGNVSPMISQAVMGAPALSESESESEQTPEEVPEVIIEDETEETPETSPEPIPEEGAETPVPEETVEEVEEEPEATEEPEFQEESSSTEEGSIPESGSTSEANGDDVLPLLPMDDAARAAVDFTNKLNTTGQINIGDEVVLTSTLKNTSKRDYHANKWTATVPKDHFGTNASDVSVQYKQGNSWVNTSATSKISDQNVTFEVSLGKNGQTLKTNGTLEVKITLKTNSNLKSTVDTNFSAAVFGQRAGSWSGWSTENHDTKNSPTKFTIHKGDSPLTFGWDAGLSTVDKSVEDYTKTDEEDFEATFHWQEQDKQEMVMFAVYKGDEQIGSTLPDTRHNGELSADTITIPNDRIDIGDNEFTIYPVDAKGARVANRKGLTLKLKGVKGRVSWVSVPESLDWTIDAGQSGIFTRNNEMEFKVKDTSEGKTKWHVRAAVKLPDEAKFSLRWKKESGSGLGEKNKASFGGFEQVNNKGNIYKKTIVEEHGFVLEAKEGLTPADLTIGTVTWTLNFTPTHK